MAFDILSFCDAWNKAEAEADIVHIARISYQHAFTEALAYELEKGREADHELVDYLRKEVKRLRRILGDSAFFGEWNKQDDRRMRTRYRVQQWWERQRKREAVQSE